MFNISLSLFLYCQDPDEESLWVKKLEVECVHSFLY